MRSSESAWGPGKRNAAAAAFFALSAAVAANPFLGNSADPAPPAVRAPSGSGPAFLVSLQIALRDKAADFFSAFKTEPRLSTIAAVLAVAFLYGILHAAGPGHRKTVLFSLFIARNAAPWEPLAAGFLSAFVHAASGIAVVLVLGVLRGTVAPLADTQNAGAYLEAGTFIALILLTLLLGIHKTAHMVRGNSGHEHGSGFGKLGLYGIVMVTSVVPCPGAVIMLLFSLYLELAWIGAACVLAMSVGMGIVISAAAYLAYFGRVSLFSRLKGKERAVQVVADFMELGSYLLVLGFSLYMAWPVLKG